MLIKQVMVWQNESYLVCSVMGVLSSKTEFHKGNPQNKTILTFLHRNPGKGGKRVKSQKAQVATALEQKHGMWWEQEALLLGWEDESALSSEPNPGCILMETGCACPDMLYVWVTLFITSNTSSGLWLAQQYNCHRCLQLQPMIYYLAVVCPTWVHTTAHTVALSQTALPCF